MANFLKSLGLSALLAVTGAKAGTQEKQNAEPANIRSYVATYHKDSPIISGLFPLNEEGKIRGIIRTYDKDMVPTMSADIENGAINGHLIRYVKDEKGNACISEIIPYKNGTPSKVVFSVDSNQNPVMRPLASKGENWVPLSDDYADDFEGALNAAERHSKALGFGLRSDGKRAVTQEEFCSVVEKLNKQTNKSVSNAVETLANTLKDLPLSEQEKQQMIEPLLKQAQKLPCSNQSVKAAQQQSQNSKSKTIRERLKKSPIKGTVPFRNPQITY